VTISVQDHLRTYDCQLVWQANDISCFAGGTMLARGAWCRSALVSGLAFLSRVSHLSGLSGLTRLARLACRASLSGWTLRRRLRG